MIKQTLKSIGLLSVAKNAAKKVGILPSRSFILKKYADVNNWHFKYHGLNLVYDTSDSYSKLWFFPRYDKGKIHEPKATDIFIDQIKGDSVVLDIGGHLGYFSCISGDIAKNGSVHVFEVDPKCLSLIKDNLKLNKIDNVQVHNYAVSDLKEKIKIPEYENPNPSLVINSNLSEEYIEVQSVVIDDFLLKNNINPDFIKIDIEGAEWKALNGMKKTLENSNATILLEIHVNNLRKHFDTNYKSIIKLLLDYGYCLKEVEHRKSDGGMKDIDLNTRLHDNTMILCQKSA